MGTKITLINCVSKNNGGAGISLPADGVEIDAHNLRLEGNAGGGLVVREAPSIAERLGLPADIDPALLVEVLQQLKNHPAYTQQNKLSLVKRSRLYGFLKRSGVVATQLLSIASNLITIGSSPDVQRVISDLTGK